MLSELFNICIYKKNSPLVRLFQTKWVYPNYMTFYTHTSHVAKISINFSNTKTFKEKFVSKSEL
jgi:hypothetical protein